MKKDANIRLLDLLAGWTEFLSTETEVETWGDGSRKTLADRKRLGAELDQVFVLYQDVGGEKVSFHEALDRIVQILIHGKVERGRT